MQRVRGRKRILVDGSSLAMEMKGVGRYTANVLREWGAQDLNHDYVILVPALKPLPPLPQGRCFEYVPTRVFDHFRHGWLTLPRLARKFKADSAWIPYETTLGQFPCPCTMVCHDVPELIQTSQQAGGARLNLSRKLMAHTDHLLIQRSLKKAAVVFANSHFVSDWLHQSLGISGERVRYAPCAPGADFSGLGAGVNRDAVRESLTSAQGYVLVFATGDRRENLQVVLDVFNALAAKTGVNFVIGGTRDDEAEKIRALTQNFSWCERVRVLPFFGEMEMPQLANVYAGACLYLDLSLHEGFGMQVIEAMACGTPVVCSNRGALPEVAGQAAHLVNPENVPEVVAAVVSVLEQPETRNRLRAAGREQAATYTWSATARTIYDALEGL